MYINTVGQSATAVKVLMLIVLTYIYICLNLFLTSVLLPTYATIHSREVHMHYNFYQICHIFVVSIRHLTIYSCLTCRWMFSETLTVDFKFDSCHRSPYSKYASCQSAKLSLREQNNIFQVVLGN